MLWFPACPPTRPSFLKALAVFNKQQSSVTGISSATKKITIPLSVDQGMW